MTAKKIFTADSNKSPGVDDKPKVKLSYKNAPNKEYPKVINKLAAINPKKIDLSLSLKKISAIPDFIKIVGKIHIGKPLNKSANAEPITALKIPTFLPHKKIIKKIAASPKCAYPSGIGILGINVATKTNATIIEVKVNSFSVNVPTVQYLK